MASLNVFDIICITETHFNSEIGDAEIAIPNYTIFREDREGDLKGGGSCIYVKSNLYTKKLTWFKGTDSLAVVVKLPSTELYIVCLYRSTSLKSLEENKNLLSQIANIPAESDKNIVLVGDINLPNVDWNRGIVVCPENSIDRRFDIQNQYLDLFIMKGFHWYVDNQATRIRKVKDQIQKSTLDQVFSNNDSLINCLEILAPLGKSDHISLSLELNLSVNSNFLTSSRKNWFKVDSHFVDELARDIDWSYSAEVLDVANMWDEISNKMLSITDQVPETKIKTNGRGEILKKLPWDSSKIVRKRKEKDQAWKAFDERPDMIVFQSALHKQNEYNNVELVEKLKYEHKLVRNLKMNSKPFPSLLDLTQTAEVLSKKIQLFSSPKGTAH